MDLKAYYRRIRETEEGLADDCVLLVSEQTPGGKAGVITEANRQTAAKVIVQGKARLATEAEATAFREAEAEARRAAEQHAALSRLHVTVGPAVETRRSKG